MSRELDVLDRLGETMRDLLEDPCGRDECYECLNGPVYDEGLCKRCHSKAEAADMGFISDCSGCGEIHDVIELCPEIDPS